MITKLRAENFKSWKDTGELQLAPLTGLFGTNSSGKSSIMQMLLMLKQTAESADRSRVLYTDGDERSFVNLGTFDDLIYNHNLESQLHLSFSWKLSDPIISRLINVELPSGNRDITILFETNQLSFDSIIKEDLGLITVKNFTYEFINLINNQITRFGMIQEKDNYEFIHTNYEARLIEGKTSQLPNPTKCYGFPNEAIGYYQNTGFLPTFALEFERLFSRVIYLGPLREYPKRTHLWMGEPPLDVGIRGDRTVAALLASQILNLKSKSKSHRYKLIVDIVRKWMKDMGLIETLNLRPIAEGSRFYEVRVKKNEKSPEVLLTGLGFGVSQILPVLVLCYYVPEGSIILLEHPEIHLHPSAQADLADVLIDVVKYRNVQIIVESHSEHLLRRLQRRVAEEAIPSDKVNLYFCRMENGASQIEKLQLDEYGSIKNWPPNFFGDEMGELSAMTKAVMKRKSLRVS